MKLFALLMFAVQMWATTLTGTLKLPDGTGANGQLQLSLAQQAALLSTGGCGGPAEIVPNTLIRITVVNGVMQSPPSIYGNDCMLPNGVYYIVRFIDNNGNLLFTDRWVITGASIDIGTIQSVVITGTTTSLGGAGLVLTQPLTQQTVTQPGTTYLVVNRLQVTESLFGPLGDQGWKCDLAGCGFGSAVAFNGGITTLDGTNSQIFIGTNGNFYNRTFSGADAVCAGINDGWAAIRTDAVQLQVCVGGVVKRVQLVD